MNPKELRTQLEINQTDFWTRLGVSQSSGSRFENGRALPAPIQKLIVLAYYPKEESSAVLKALRR